MGTWKIVHLKDRKLELLECPAHVTTSQAAYLWALSQGIEQERWVQTLRPDGSVAIGRMSLTHPSMTTELKWTPPAEEETRVQPVHHERPRPETPAERAGRLLFGGAG